MKLDNLTAKISPIRNFIVRYAVIIFVLSVVSIFAFMTLNIAHYSNLEPTSDQTDERKNSLTSVKLDEKSISKIKELQDQNISIESLFDNGRENPFQ